MLIRCDAKLNFYDFTNDFYLSVVNTANFFNFIMTNKYYLYTF